MNTWPFIPVDILVPPSCWRPVLYRLQAPLRIAHEVVPAGFVSDGATVPWWLRWLVPVVGASLPAVLLHDWKLKDGHGWKASNKAFRRALRELRIHWLRRWLMAAGTSAWGSWRVLRGDPR